MRAKKEQLKTKAREAAIEEDEIKVEIGREIGVGMKMRQDGSNQ
jgi:hypothetical protein